MDLHLIQHGEAYDKQTDPDRPLTPKGREHVEDAAQALFRLGVKLDGMVCSEKKRAMQTAQTIAAALGFPEEEVITAEEVKAKTPPDQTVDFLKNRLGDKNSVLIAGHMPHLQELASLLLAGGRGASIDFRNAGVVKIEVPELPTAEATLSWYLPPEALRRMVRT
jgi:phosphohistidine phosphatase